MHRYTPYHVPSSPLSSSPHRLRARTQKRAHSPPGAIYMSERFEVVVQSSPPSPPPAHLNEMPCEEVPPARAARALGSLHAALACVETGISRVAHMREQQAGFVSCQMRLLDSLKDEAAVIDEELAKRRLELDAVEKAIAKLLEKSPLRPRSSRRTKQGWTQTFQLTLRSMRTKSI